MFLFITETSEVVSVLTFTYLILSGFHGFLESTWKKRDGHDW